MARTLRCEPLLQAGLKVLGHASKPSRMREPTPRLWQFACGNRHGTMP